MLKPARKAFEALQEIEYIRYEDLPLKAKDGQLVQVEFVSNVYLVGAEKVIQCNIRNITERKQAQDALLKSEAMLRELSVRDYLTGLFNRRYMEVTLERELQRALRNQYLMGIIMLDVDNFKSFNDTYGHAAGDEILHEVGSLLLTHVRREDIPCRYGGDEFAIVLPGASREVTQERAEFIRENARYIRIHTEGQKHKAVTFSLGVAIFPENGPTSAAVLRAADDALYRAKLQGRDHVVVADCSLATGNTTR